MYFQDVSKWSVCGSFEQSEYSKDIGTLQIYQKACNQDEVCNGESVLEQLHATRSDELVKHVWPPIYEDQKPCHSYE